MSGTIALSSRRPPLAKASNATANMNSLERGFDRHEGAHGPKKVHNTPRRSASMESISSVPREAHPRPPAQPSVTPAHGLARDPVDTIVVNADARGERAPGAATPPDIFAGG